jgi:hypothetical protein
LPNEAQAACQRSNPLISMTVLLAGSSLPCSVEEQTAEQFCCDTKQRPSPCSHAIGILRPLFERAL